MFDKLTAAEKNIIHKYCIGTFYEALSDAGRVRIGYTYIPDNVDRGFIKNGVELQVKEHFLNLKELVLQTRGIRQAFNFGHRVSLSNIELNQFRERYTNLFDMLEININFKQDDDTSRRFMVWIGKDQFETNQAEKSPHCIEILSKIHKYETKVLSNTAHYRFRKTEIEPNQDHDPNEAPIALSNNEVYTEYLRGGEAGLKNDMWDMNGLIYKSITNYYNHNGGQFFVKGVIYEGQDLDDMKLPELERILNAYWQLDRQLSNSIIYFSKG